MKRILTGSGRLVASLVMLTFIGAAIGAAYAQQAQIDTAPAAPESVTAVAVPDTWPTENLFVWCAENYPGRIDDATRCMATVLEARAEGRL